MGSTILVNVFGSAALGTILNGGLVGVICVFSYQYYLKFPNDSIITKSLVAWNMILQIFNLALESRVLYHYLVQSYGISQNLRFATWEWGLYLGIIAISSLGVEVFYAHRIFLLSGRKWMIPFLIIVSGVLALGFCLATVATVLKVKEFALINNVWWLLSAWLAFTAFCDGSIALSQVYYLYKKRTPIPRTNRAMSILIRYIVGSGAITGCFVIIELATSIRSPFNFCHIFISYLMSSLHVIAFLANLHARQSVRDIMKTDISLETPDFGMQSWRLQRTGLNPSGAKTSVPIAEQWKGDSTSFASQDVSTGPSDSGIFAENASTLDGERKPTDQNDLLH
ncbi:hypothetical protein CPC08DRAFT_821198 [Agrocybe pediades]|nr:hypothetical protein CPC08DRAFT_821198 [Agrocybe pediades]